MEGLWANSYVLYWGLTYAWGCFHLAYVRRHNVPVPAGSGRYIKLCRDEGIVRHFTVRVTPQQNWVAERMNKTLLEKVRCMLSNAGLSKNFWVEALAYACYLVNRLPSSVIGGKTHLKVWSGKAAQDYDSLRVFGCPANYHVKEDKLDPRAKNVCL